MLTFLSSPRPPTTYSHLRAENDPLSANRLTCGDINPFRPWCAQRRVREAMDKESHVRRERYMWTVRGSERSHFRILVRRRRNLNSLRAKSHLFLLE